MYKTSFNGLEKYQHGIYSAYGLNREEFESLQHKFGPTAINGSNGNYTVFRNAKRQVLLKLFVHNLWIPITFNIRNDLLKIYGSNRIYKADIEKISQKLKAMRVEIHVDRDSNGNWYIVDYDKFLELLKKIISDS